MTDTRTPYAADTDRKFTTVVEIATFLRSRAKIGAVMVWVNVFLEDGVYLPTTRKALYEALCREAGSTPTRASFDKDGCLWVN